MHRSLVQMIRYSDVRVFYAVSALFIIPVYMIFGSAYGIVYRLYRHHLKMGRVRSCWMVYRNLYSFSKVVIDKFAMAGGKLFSIDIEGHDCFEELTGKSDGFIQLSSHIGNLEIAGYSLKSNKKPLNVVVFGGEKSSVMEFRERLLSKTNMKIIPIGEGIEHIFAMNRVLMDGEILSIPADRIFGSDKSVSVRFLDGNVELPEGPFHLAAMRDVDVVAINVMKISVKRYRVYITKLNYNKDARTAQKVAELAGAYATELERMVRMYPEQWYNYFEFWKS